MQNGYIFYSMPFVCLKPSRIKDLVEHIFLRHYKSEFNSFLRNDRFGRKTAIEKRLTNPHGAIGYRSLCIGQND